MLQYNFVLAGLWPYVRQASNMVPPCRAEADPGGDPAGRQARRRLRAVAQRRPGRRGVVSVQSRDPGEQRQPPRDLQRGQRQQAGAGHRCGSRAEGQGGHQPGALSSGTAHRAVQPFGDTPQLCRLWAAHMERYNGCMCCGWADTACTAQHEGVDVSRTTVSCRSLLRGVAKRAARTACSSRLRTARRRRER